MTIIRGSGSIAPSNSTSSSGGGIAEWNPNEEQDKIVSGEATSPNTFVLTDNLNVAIDDIAPCNKGTIIHFFDDTSRWGIISGEDKNKGVFQTVAQLNTTYPTSSIGDYALVTQTGTFFAFYENVWNDTLKTVAPDSLRSTNNLNDLSNKATARTNLSVYSKVEMNTSLAGKVDTVIGKGLSTNDLTNALLDKLNNTPINTNSVLEGMKTDSASGFQGVYDTFGIFTLDSTRVTDFDEATQDVVGGMAEDTSTIDATYNDTTNKIKFDLNDNSVGNNHIATNAGIASSKITQATITPIDAIFANGDTQDVINNKAQGRIDANKTLATHANRSILDATQESLTTAKQTKYEGAYMHSIATGNPHGTTLAQVGGDQLNNTSDLNKPISTATQQALDLKESLANKVTSFASPNDTSYPTTKASKDALDLKQNITDNSLNTTVKTIVGAINEVKASDNLKAPQSTTYTKTENDASFLTKVDKLTGKSLISDTEIAKLLTVAANATSNQTNAYLLSRDNHTGTQSISTVVGLQASLDAKANDNTVVKLTGDQTIAGIKTFTAFPVSPASLPISQYEFANKQYVDNSVIGGLKYQGTWNALTNTPTLSNGTSTNGYLYRVNVAGTQNFGAGNISFAIDDKVVYNPSNVWEKWDTSDEVASVNTKTGAVVLNQDEILDGANYKQYSLTEKTKLAGIQEGAEVNVQADYSQTDNMQDNFIKNKPTLGTVASKNVGTAIGDIQENGAILGNSQTVETDASGKIITAVKNDAYNKSFGTSAGTVAQGNDARLSTNLAVGNKTATTFDILSDTGNDATLPQATITEAGLLSAADKVKINNSLTTKNVKILYVSCGINGSGNDSNDGLSELTALGTLAAANTKADGTGVEIRQLPSQSTESVTFTHANLQLSGSTYRANSGTTGTITANPSSGSQTYSKYSFGNFVKSGAKDVVMRDIAVSNSLSNTGAGSLDIIDSDFSTTPLSFTGVGITRFYNCRGGVPTVNNANAFVYIGNNQSVAAPTLTAGTLALENCIVYVAQATTLTLGAVGATISLNNVRFIYPDSTEAAINIPVGALYSFAGVNLYKSTSTILGTDISSSSSNYIQNVKINTLNLPKLTASQRLETDASKTLVSVAKGTADNQSYSTTVGDIKANGTGSLGSLNTLPRADHIHPTDTSRAPIDSPSFTGTPLVPTATAGTNNTQIASTAFATTLATTLINALKGSPTTAGDTLKELEDRIIALEALLSTATDGDTIVNTYYELLQAAQNFPEGSTFLGELNKRVSFGTIANRPTAVAENNGYVYITIDGVSTTGTTYISNGTSWVQVGYSKTEIDSSLATKQPLNSKLTALGGLSTARGILVQNGIDTGSETFVKRQITGGTGISVNNGDGVLGNPTISIQTGNTADKACAGNDARLGTKDIDETNQANGKILGYNSSLDKLVYFDKASGIYTVNSTAEMVLLTGASLNELAIVRDAEPYTLYQLAMLPATVLSNWKIVGGGSGGSGGFPVVNDASETVVLNNQVSTGTTHYIGQFVEFVGRPTAVPITTTEKPTLIVYGTLAKVVQIFIHSGITYTRERINDLWGDWKTPASSSGGGLDYIQGVYDASSNAYPTSANTLLGDAVQKGYKWIISVQGMLGTKIIFPDCVIEARENNPGQTSAKWQTYQNTLGYTPENIAFKNQANGYLGTDSNNQFAPSFVKQDANNRFVSDTEKATWNGKQNALPTGTASQYLNGTGSLSQVDHADLSNTGTNTHAQIDTALLRLQNTSGTNTGDETTATIKTKLGASSASSDGYLSSVNFSDFASRVTQAGLTSGLDTKQASSTTLTTLASSTNPQTLVKIASISNPTSADSGKNFQINSNGDVVLGNSGTGNVICNDTTANGDFVMFSADKTITKQTAAQIKTALGLTLTDVSNTAVTLTPAQKRITAKNLGGYPSLTTTERDTITDWAVNEQLYNTTLSRFEKWNGTIFVSALNNIGSFIYSYSSTPPLNTIRCDNTAISRTNYYELFSLLNPNIATSITSTISIGSPCIVGKTAHGLAAGGMVKFTTTGSLPTGITAGTVYFVTPISTSQFYLSTSKSAFLEQNYVTTSGTQSGTHSYRYSLYGFGNDTTTFNVPDAQGLSLRTLDTTTNIDFATPARVLGSMQTSGTAVPRNQTVKKVTSTGGTTSTLDAGTNPSYLGFVRCSKTGESLTSANIDSGGINEMDVLNAVTGDAETNVKNMALYLYIQVL